MSVNPFGIARAAGLAGFLAVAALAASATAASAHYTTTRCDNDGDRCWVMRCDDDGDDCYRVRSYARHYDRPRPRWVCDDWDGDDCHWVYPRRHYARPRVGLRFGWGD